MPKQDDVDRLMIDCLVTCARFVRANSRHSGEGDAHAAVWRALATLEQYGPMRVGEFAEIDRCSQPTATIMLRRLEEAGTVVRVPDPSDGRASLLSLSPAGRRRLADLRRNIAERLRPARPHLSAAEMTALREALPAIRKLIEVLD